MDPIERIELTVHLSFYKHDNGHDIRPREPTGRGDLVADCIKCNMRIHATETSSFMFLFEEVYGSPCTG